jgi:hypothetical protein
MRTPIPAKLLWLATLVVVGLALAGSSGLRSDAARGTVLVAALSIDLDRTHPETGDCGRCIPCDCPTAAQCRSGRSSAAR